MCKIGTFLQLHKILLSTLEIHALNCSSKMYHFTKRMVPGWKGPTLLISINGYCPEFMHLKAINTFSPFSMLLLNSNYFSELLLNIHPPLRLLASSNWGQRWDIWLQESENHTKAEVRFEESMLKTLQEQNTRCSNTACM